MTSTLREEMGEDLTLSGITLKSEMKYLREVSNLARHFGKSPEHLGEAEVREYLAHLLEDRNLSVGTYKHCVSGIKFLYNTTLKREDVVAHIPYPKGKTTLPWRLL